MKIQLIISTRIFSSCWNNYCLWSFTLAEWLQAVNRCVVVSAYVSAAEDNKIVIPYVPSHLHHMMFELMKVNIIIIIIIIIIFISVKTHHSTNIQHLSCRTGTTTTGKLPNSGARVRLLTSQSLTRWRHQGRHQNIVLLLIYLPGKDERLSWPSWLTCNERFTHIVVTRRLQAEHRTGSVRRPKTGILLTVLCNQLVGIYYYISPCIVTTYYWREVSAYDTMQYYMQVFNIHWKATELPA